MLTLMIQQTFIITTFVMGMMIIIEYVNVQTRGLWTDNIQKSPFTQILLGSLMGIIPGCLGSYTMVSLYIHRVVMFPAIVATMIATSGDEAFLMFSLIPGTALKLNIILLAIAVSVGIIVHYTVKNKFIGLKGHVDLPLHHRNEECNPYDPKQAFQNLKNISFTRALLIAGVIGLLLAIISGAIDGNHHLNTLMGNAVDAHQDHAHEGHDHSVEADWIRISLISIFVVILFIFVTVKDHFLQDHLWNHIIRKHFLKIFLWTFGVLLAIYFLNQFVNIESWISANLWVVLGLALLIGIIPESGPHYIFVLLFAQGILPLSILLASSIAQDGHGTLPLLAETPKSFIAVKAVNLLVAFIAGAVGILIGF
ncbi:MAG: hypothetical protein CVT92_05325 [Bacteroidetes bacterium HGW-Bacteroidetes-1]|jgi:hypothetical protein|nr:MAG: hypothetical protein CVT92_05325 [Bacteroidetes bacterium HGW-Bacteroidetes-1]